MSGETHIKVTGSAVTRVVESAGAGASIFTSVAAYQNGLNMLSVFLGAVLTSVLIWYWIRKGSIAEREMTLKENQAENEKNRLDDLATSYSTFLTNEQCRPHRRKSDNLTKEQIVESILENKEMMDALKSRILKNEDTQD